MCLLCVPSFDRQAAGASTLQETARPHNNVPTGKAINPDRIPSYLWLTVWSSQNLIKNVSARLSSGSTGESSETLQAFLRNKSEHID